MTRLGTRPPFAVTPASEDPALERLVILRAEYQAWRNLCDLLIASGAVTRADANSGHLDRETPGQRIFAALREWGDRLVELRNAPRLQ